MKHQFFFVRIFLLSSHREPLGARLRERCDLVSVVLPRARRTRMAFLKQLLMLEETSTTEEGSEAAAEDGRGLLKRLVSLHLDVSEAAGKFQSLKCLEVMGAKTSGERKMEGRELRGIVADVYGVGEQLVDDISL